MIEITYGENEMKQFHFIYFINECLFKKKEEKNQSNNQLKY